MSPTSTQKRIVVVGGGMTGLAAAHRLHELDPALDIILLEAGGHLGGMLDTVRRDGFLIERGADNFITTQPWGLDLCRRIGFEDKLAETNEGHRRAFVVCKNRLEPIPPGFLIMAPSRLWPVLTTPIFSWRGKLRLGWEYFVPVRKEEGDESLASFVKRRLGREVYERLVQPLVGGIYTADPEQLSLQATMPRFLEMERQHGGLIRATWRKKTAGRKDHASSGARYSMFVAARDGMDSLIAAIAARLPDHTVRLNSPVEQMTHDPAKGWSLQLGGDSPQTLTTDSVIVATPAYRAAQLMQNLDSELATLLEQIPHAGCAIVSLAYRREQIGHPLDGFGYVTPLVERRKTLSGSFSSVKYPGRAPDGFELFRVFIGGACQQELVDLPDEELASLASADLSELLSIRGEPVFHETWRPCAMPQYHVGHPGLVTTIESHVSRLPGLHLAGNFFQGVGIPFCIRSGEQAAEKVAAEILPRPVESRTPSH